MHGRSLYARALYEVGEIDKAKEQLAIIDTYSKVDLRQIAKSFQDDIVTLKAELDGVFMAADNSGVIFN